MEKEASHLSVKNSSKYMDYEEHRIAPLFNALLTAGKTELSFKHFVKYLDSLGLAIESDPRLKPVAQAWRDIGAPKKLNLAIFSKLIHHAFSLIEHAIKGELIIPEFSNFIEDLKPLLERAKENNEGEVAAYIPQLARVPADKFAVSLCTIDGQRYSFGDSEDFFCVQSTSKPISYCLALEEQGEEEVHRHVGCEPSGRSFNELKLNRQGLPHNPMINSGAIMTSALIKPDLSRADRFDYVMRKWCELMGGESPRFSNPIYLSERETADRNFALGYFMRESNAFPEGTNLIETLEFYFQCCSLEVNSKMMSVLAATLANGGVCPLTEERVLQPATVQRCLSLMYSCGMYNFSGEWAFSVGLPAKCGVSGAIMVVVPNVMGFCSWSPRLDENGNAIKGITFYKSLLSKFNFHNFDNLLQDSHHQKLDPRRIAIREKTERNNHLLWAASTNEIPEIRRLIAKGIDLSEPSYDGRTALHIAASEGHLDAVQLLAANGVPLYPRDRWGSTPYDDALKAGHTDIAEWLNNQAPIKARKICPQKDLA